MYVCFSELSRKVQFLGFLKLIIFSSYSLYMFWPFFSFFCWASVELKQNSSAFFFISGSSSLLLHGQLRNFFLLLYFSAYFFLLFFFLFVFTRSGMYSQYCSILALFTIACTRQIDQSDQIVKYYYMPSRLFRKQVRIPLVQSKHTKIYIFWW